MIPPKKLSLEVLKKIEEEWSDSKTVCDLLGHISFLTHALAMEAAEKQEARGGDGDGH